MKRLLVALGAMTVVLLPTSAFAASASFTNLSSGAIVSNTVTVRCQGSGNSGVAKVELFINGSSVAKHSPGGIEQTADTSYNWTTNGLRNGEQRFGRLADDQRDGRQRSIEPDGRQCLGKRQPGLRLVELESRARHHRLPPRA
jgi:hypothetical protein